MSNIFIDAHRDLFQKPLDHFQDELKHIRTGQAHPDLLDGIMIEAYGALTPIIHLGSVTAPDARMLVIQPWDKSVVKAIEKGITASGRGFSAVVDGDLIRVPMPMMSEENRKDMVKVVGQKAEHARVSIRQGRDKVKEAIHKAEDENVVTEDEKFKAFKQLDEYTSTMSKKVNEMAEKKQEQIMTI